MRRTLGATAIFLGWLCLPLSAVAGFAAANLMNVDNRHAGLPPVTVFGFSSDLFMWLVVAAAVLATAPAFVAIFAVDPSRELYVTGAGIAIVAGLLLLDDLGRAYSVVLLPAAACFAAGGWLMAGARNEPPAWASSELLAHLRKPAVSPAAQIGLDNWAELGLEDQGGMSLPPLCLGQLLRPPGANHTDRPRSGQSRVSGGRRGRRSSRAGGFGLRSRGAN